MSDSASADRTEAEAPAGTVGEKRPRPVVPTRRPPPMRVVTKGWWTLEEGTADIEALRQGAMMREVKPPNQDATGVPAGRPAADPPPQPIAAASDIAASAPDPSATKRPEQKRKPPPIQFSTHLYRGGLG